MTRSISYAAAFAALTRMAAALAGTVENGTNCWKVSSGITNSCRLALDKAVAYDVRTREHSGLLSEPVRIPVRR